MYMYTVGSIEGTSKVEKVQKSVSWPSMISQRIAIMETSWKEERIA